MFHDDWDFVVDPLRTLCLERMWHRYEHLLGTPSQWDRMDAFAWDAVPQPMRAVAFIEMVRYWSGFYQVGARFGLPRGTVTNTMAAIMMTESLFEHRAIHTNAAGNRDLGLAQASDYTRMTLTRLHQAGRIDFAPAGDAAYDDPWQATRVIALWFDLMLDETRGDLDLAVRAYHRGAPLALAGEGVEYLDVVVGRRRRYFRDPSGSPTWEFLRERGRALADHIRAAAAESQPPARRR
jgi:hypothetical protein